MKTKIENKEEFEAVIDQYGDALAEIKTKKDEAEVLKQMLEVYALQTQTRRQSTERYTLAMKREDPALRRAPGVEEKDVVALLKKSECGRAYIVTSYDGKALKLDLSGSDEGIEQLASFGLMLTEPQPHAKVTKRVR